MSGRSGIASAGRRIPAALALALALPACAALDVSPPWAFTSAVVAPEDSLTVQRVLGQEPPTGPLSPETGDVWPEEEAPRATLANPDEALRGIPTYRPEGLGGGRADPLRERTTPPATDQPGPPPRRRARGSSTPPPTADLPPPERDLRNPTPLAPQPLSPPPPVAGGRVITVPGRPPAVTSGGTDRVQSFNEPGGGSGVVVRDGPTTTIIGPDGQVRVVPTPPR